MIGRRIQEVREHVRRLTFGCYLRSLALAPGYPAYMDGRW